MARLLERKTKKWRVLREQLIKKMYYKKIGLRGVK